MAQTTLTTLATVVPAEYIQARILEAAAPKIVVAPLVLNLIQPNGQGVTWNQSQFPAITAVSVTEASDLAAVARTTTEASGTIAEVGVNTEVTMLGLEASRIQSQLFAWADQSAAAIATKIDGDLCALFSALNSATAVGTSGTDVTVANFLEAVYTLDNGNAPGQKVCVLHPRQVIDLFNAMSSSTGTPFASLQELVREGRLPGGLPAAGFVGQVFGVPIYQTTEVDTDGSALNRIGAMFVKDAMAFVQLRPVTVKYQEDISKRSTEVVVTTAYGVGELVDGYGVPITTDA